MFEEDIIEVGRRLYEKNLTVSTSGNISLKTDKGIYITATGSQLGNLKKEDIILIDLDGEEISKGKASSEKKLHVEIYKKRLDVQAIIHVHSLYLTTFAAACQKLDAPLLSENILYFEDIPVAPYYMPSTENLAVETSKYFEERDVVLMSNHGAVSVAKNLEKAFEKIETAEYYAHVCYNLGLLKKPKFLMKNDIDSLIELKRKMNQK